MTGPRRRVVVLDYGSGNLRSAQRALERAGAEVTVTADTAAALAADGLVVPGVGAFAACMAGLRAVGGELTVDRGPGNVFRLVARVPAHGDVDPDLDESPEGERSWLVA